MALGIGVLLVQVCERRKEALKHLTCGWLSASVLVSPRLDLRLPSFVVIITHRAHSASLPDRPLLIREIPFLVFFLPPWLSLDLLFQASLKFLGRGTSSFASEASSWRSGHFNKVGQPSSLFVW